MTDINVIVNDETYTLKLKNNKTTKKFTNLLSLEFIMNDLNDNDKYVYLDNHLTTNPYNPKHIKKGDIMLYIYT